MFFFFFSEMCDCISSNARDWYCFSFLFSILVVRHFVDFSRNINYWRHTMHLWPCVVLSSQNSISLPFNDKPILQLSAINERLLVAGQMLLAKWQVFCVRCCCYACVCVCRLWICVHSMGLVKRMKLENLLFGRDPLHWIM